MFDAFDKRMPSHAFSFLKLYLVFRNFKAVVDLEGDGIRELHCVPRFSSNSGKIGYFYFAVLICFKTIRTQTDF